MTMDKMLPGRIHSSSPDCKLLKPLVLLCWLQAVTTLSSGRFYSFGYYRTAYNSTGSMRVTACTCNSSTSTQLLLSTPQRSDVFFSITNTTTFDYSINEKDLFATFPFPVIFGKTTNAFMLSADHDVSVFVTQSGDTGVDGYLAIPVTRNSTEFFVATWPAAGSAFYSGIIATPVFSDTLVEFYQLNGDDKYTRIDNYNLPDSHTSALLIANTSLNTTGIFVNSSKPISVTAGITCGSVPKNVRFCDFMAEQIPPVSELGKIHVVPPIIGRSQTAGYIVVVVATRPDTLVEWDAGAAIVTPASPVTLNVGRTVQINVGRTSQASLVTCSQPCLVMQYNKGKGAAAELTSTDPFSMLTAPVDHFVPTACFSTANFRYKNNITNFFNYLSIVTLTENTLNILLDGVNILRRNVSISTSGFSADTVGNYTCVSGPVSHGSHWLSVTPGSNAVFAAYVYGHSSIADSATAYGLVAAYKVFSAPVTSEWVSTDATSNADYTGPTVTELSPSFGPVAGGTKLTIKGQNLNCTSSITVIMYSAADRQTLTAKYYSSDYWQLSTVTPPYNGTVNGNGNRFVVILKFGDGRIVNSGRYFEYRYNPIVDGLQPLVQKLNGGSLVTVTGSRLDSVAVPDISVTAIVTRGSVNIAQLQNIGPCDVTSTTRMTCLMPAVPLPDIFRGSVINSSVWSLDGQQEAGITVGLHFDGFTQYNDLSRALNGLQFTFLVCQPQIQSSSADVELNEESDHNIVIRGAGLQTGCTLSTYRVTVGQSQCTCNLLDDTRLNCLLPVDKPLRSENDTFCSEKAVALLMYVDDRDPFFVVCVRYVFTTSKTGLVVGLTVGLVGGVLAALSVVAAVLFILAKRRRKRLVKKMAATVTSTNAKLAETYKRKAPIVYLHEEDITEPPDSQS